MDCLVHSPMSEVRQVPDNDTELPKSLAHSHPTWSQLPGQRWCTARPLNCGAWPQGWGCPLLTPNKGENQKQVISHGTDSSTPWTVSVSSGFPGLCCNRAQRDLGGLQSISLVCHTDDITLIRSEEQEVGSSSEDMCALRHMCSERQK